MNHDDIRLCENGPHLFNLRLEGGISDADGIYKRTEFAIENVIDICAIINSDLGLEMPNSDESIVASLAKAGILTNDMADKIKRMRGFRNIVVHRYGKIDDRVTHAILTANIDDFYQFASRSRAL